MNKLVLSGIVAGAMLLSACGGGSSPSKVNHNTPAIKQTGGDLPMLHSVKSNLEKNATKANATAKQTITIANKNYPDAQGIRTSQFPQGFSQHTYSHNLQLTDKATGDKVDIDAQGTLYIFQQKHSTIANANIILNKSSFKYTKEPKKSVIELAESIIATPFSTYVAGNPTTTLPSAGVYRYTGEAHLSDAEYKNWQKGMVGYSIDFGQKMGHGRIQVGDHVIRLLDTPIKKFTLENADDTTLSAFGVETGKITSSQSKTGFYSLALFGADASEISGTVDFDDKVGLFGGSKK